MISTLWIFIQIHPGQYDKRLVHQLVLLEQCCQRWYWNKNKETLVHIPLSCVYVCCVCVCKSVFMNKISNLITKLCVTYFSSSSSTIVLSGLVTLNSSTSISAFSLWSRSDAEMDTSRNPHYDDGQRPRVRSSLLYVLQLQSRAPRYPQGLLPILTSLLVHV